MKEHQVAWLAGVLDSLARFRVHQASGTDLAWLGISSPDLELLRRCARMTGVGVTEVRRNYQRVGCTAHCQEPHLHVASTTGRWQLVGARAVVVLHAVRPYLECRAGEVDQVLAATSSAPAKAATLAKMEALGWRLPPAPRDSAKHVAQAMARTARSRAPPCVW